MGRTESLERTLVLGKIEGGRKKGTTEDGMVGWLTDSVDMSLSNELVMDREA